MCCTELPVFLRLWGVMLSCLTAFVDVIETFNSAILFVERSFREAYPHKVCNNLQTRWQSPVERWFTCLRMFSLNSKSWHGCGATLRAGRNHGYWKDVDHFIDRAKWIDLSVRHLVYQFVCVTITSTRIYRLALNSKWAYLVQRQSDLWLRTL